MKKIFRSAVTAMGIAAMLALGAVAIFAQDPCTDAEGISKLDGQIRELLPKKDIDSRKAAIDAGKQFLEKYGSCDGTKDFSDYLRTTVPKLEGIYAAMVEKIYKDKLIAKFNGGLDKKNWDDVYSAGKELLNKYPDEFRAAELVLGSIGLDELIDNKNSKWNDDTIYYAKMAISDMESGKKFPTYGVGKFSYKDQADATGWMNYTIGYIMAVGKNDKKDGVSYLYKTTQSTSTAKTTPLIYQTIGAYYYDSAKKLFDEVNALIAGQVDTDTPEVKQQKVDAIKAKIGILNGTTERAMDAYSRAYSLAPATPAGKAYRDSLFSTLTDLYKVRNGGKVEGLDAWITSATSKPMPDPTTAITPVNDPDPTTTTTSTSTTTAPPATPAVTTPAKPAPATKPTTVVKPQSAVTSASKSQGTSASSSKVVAKKKGTNN